MLPHVSQIYVRKKESSYKKNEQTLISACTECDGYTTVTFTRALQLVLYQIHHVKKKAQRFTATNTKHYIWIIRRSDMNSHFYHSTARCRVIYCNFCRDLPGRISLSASILSAVPSIGTSCCERQRRSVLPSHASLSQRDWA